VCKGAYTGATENRPGLVRSANNGTLLLDEIGDLPPSVQATLLRVLREREVKPVGVSRPVPVDFRLISATHCDLDGMIEDGGFREDLYARIAGCVVVLPALRQRREDIGLLLATLLGRLAPERAEGITMHLAAARPLLLHSWPRNIRELEQCLRVAVARARDRCINPDDLPPAIRNAPGDRSPEAAPTDPSDPPDSDEAGIRAGGCAR